MIVDIQPGIVGRSGVSWGTTADGAPVCLVESPVACVRLTMTPAEAQEHGAQAIFVGYSAKLEAGDASAKPAGILFRPDGSPL